MNREDIIRMAREAGAWSQQSKNCDVEYVMSGESLERFAAFVAAAELEAIMDEWWMCVQSDLEHGVKSLNEKAAKDFNKNYPEISKFGAFLKARGNT